MPAPRRLTAPWLPKSELASMEGVKRAFMVFQQGGVIMDVVNADQVRERGTKEKGSKSL